MKSGTSKNSNFTAEEFAVIKQGQANLQALTPLLLSHLKEIPNCFASIFIIVIPLGTRVKI